jgi:sulfur carrier protein ThiS
MKIKVFLEKENVRKVIGISKRQNIESVLKKLKINPQTVIVMKNGNAVSEQETLEGNDSLRIIRFK